jgi:hypothetical protein
VAAVDPNEINAMAKLIALMNTGVVLEDERVPVVDNRTHISEGKLLAADSTNAGLDPSIAAMKNILMAFNGTQSPAKKLEDRAVTDRVLREALVTEATDRGLRVGSWEIVINEDFQGLKSYDVTNIHTGEPIATALTVYDAALGIARNLNEGQAINSPAIRDILNTEATYDASRQDAALFRTRMEASERMGNGNRASIMEARYIEALDKAKGARVRLSKITK